MIPISLTWVTNKDQFYLHKDNKTSLIFIYNQVV